MPSTNTIMHLIDSLDPGGAERTAVNISNALSRQGINVILCSTRKTGTLQKEIHPQVKFICLNRKGKFDILSLMKLFTLINEEKIKIIHAHSSSIFSAVMVKLLYPKIKVIWHIHAGSYAEKRNFYLVNRIITKNCDGIITVTNSLAQWFAKTYQIPPAKIKFIPNFIEFRPTNKIEILPGVDDFRLICVANLRPEKDHLTLIHAMEIVRDREPRAHLILVGAASDPLYVKTIMSEIKKLDMVEYISWLGPRKDTQSIIEKCDIGILNSVSEGFPLVVLEYGLLNLAVVCTTVGECSNILDEGNGGLLVSPGDPQQLAESLLELLKDKKLRDKLSSHLKKKVTEQYSIQEITPHYVELYESL